VTTEERFSQVRERIATACARARRSAAEITLVAVSKNQPVQKMKEAIACGHNIFGENYVQEGEKKRSELGTSPSLHLIGPLQSNKAKQAVSVFDCIQSVHKKKLVGLLAKAAAELGKELPVYVQVNVSCEESKSGFPPDEVAEAVALVQAETSLTLEGLMCIGSFEAFSEAALKTKRICEFEFMRELGARCSISDCKLSMGMSDDFELAIEHGAHVIRVGTALFGPRE